MDSHHPFLKDKTVESLKTEVERLKKENETLKLMLRFLSIRNSDSRETNTDSQVEAEPETERELNQNQNPNKRARTDHQIPTLHKASSQVYIRTGFKDQTLNVKDGYQWRKYGQKITKDNQSPRAYFKCSVSGCPVKKKVQRSLEDKSVVVASYEGQHNHDSSHFPVSSLGGSSFSSSPTGGSASATHRPPPFTAETESNRAFPPASLNLDLTLSGHNEENNTRNSQNLKGELDSEETLMIINNIKAYAESLTKDPNFTVALATAVARSITDPQSAKSMKNSN